MALRTSADHMEEKLKAEILFLKEQIQAEQCLKENLEDTLQLEIEGCKEEIGENKCPQFNLSTHWIHFDESLLLPCYHERIFHLLEGRFFVLFLNLFFVLFFFPSSLITQTSWKV